MVDLLLQKENLIMYSFEKKTLDLVPGLAKSVYNQGEVLSAYQIRKAFHIAT